MVAAHEWPNCGLRATVDSILCKRSPRRRSVGSASTWSLERIASLAEEATVTFYAKLQVPVGV